MATAPAATKGAPAPQRPAHRRYPTLPAAPVSHYQYNFDYITKGASAIPPARLPPPQRRSSQAPRAMAAPAPAPLRVPYGQAHARMPRPSSSSSISSAAPRPTPHRRSASFDDLVSSAPLFPFDRTTPVVSLPGSAGGGTRDRRNSGFTTHHTARSAVFLPHRPRPLSTLAEGEESGASPGDADASSLSSTTSSSSSSDDGPDAPSSSTSSDGDLDPEALKRAEAERARLRRWRIVAEMHLARSGAGAKPLSRRSVSGHGGSKSSRAPPPSAAVVGDGEEMPVVQSAPAARKTSTRGYVRSGLSTMVVLDV